MRNVYAYAGGNPISNIDPLGLYLRVVGTSIGSQIALEDALTAVGLTQRGNELIQALQNSPYGYVISDVTKGDAYTRGTLINVDPNFHPLENVSSGNSCSVENAPTSAVLGHELGHAFRGDLYFNLQDEWNNVLQNENPIRQQLGLPIRTTYP